MTESIERTPVAIVTGASRGIGRAIAVDLASHGYHVVINYRSNAAAAEQALGLVRAAGGQAELACFDVADATATESALDALIERHPRIDVLVNNAGVIADGLFAIMPPEDWHKVIQTSLDGFFHVTKPVLKRMLSAKAGSIVNVSSISGLIGNRGQTNYSAAKAGLIGASKALAAEVARLGIRVNVVAPGLIDTEMTERMPADILKKLIPMARIGKPEEVARVVRFLCSDDASYITGEVIAVSGGMVAS